MDKKLHQAFKNIGEIKPSTNLEGKILRRVELERKKQLRFKSILTHVGLAGSVAAAVYMGLTFGNSFLQSEFWNLVTLAFSDITIVARHWQAFAMSLLETFPTMSTILLLIPVFTLLLSLGLYLDLNKKYNHRYI